jgi:Holliday junction resolvase RusA-like endonuclease
MDFFVAGFPRAKESFRVVKDRLGKLRGGYAKPEVKAWQAEVGWAARLKMAGNPPYDCRVTVILDFYLDKDYADLDNLTKAVLDSLEGIAYKNDRKVHRLSLEKHVSRGGLTGVNVTVIPYAD